MLLKIAQIRLDSKYVVRDINADTVNDYAQAISEGTTLPKPTLFYDGTSYWPGDGRHRIKAREQAGYADIEVEVRNGTERDAYIFGITAQDKNGLRLTNEDKRRAVKAILSDDEWSMKYNDTEIAKMCRVTRPFVTNVRSSIGNHSQPATETVTVADATDGEGLDVREEIPYTTQSGRRATKKNPAIKRIKREKETASHYSWKQFDTTYGALVREVDNLGRLYNRHNTEEADLLRSDLEAWKSNFMEWGELLKQEKENACVNA